MITEQVTCDHCGKDLKREYSLKIIATSELPRGGGIVTGFEFKRRFDFCNECSKEVETWLKKYSSSKGDRVGGDSK